MYQPLQHAFEVQGVNEEEQINTCLKAAAEDGSREGQEGQGDVSEGRYIGMCAVSESQKLSPKRCSLPVPQVP